MKKRMPLILSIILLVVAMTVTVMFDRLVERLKCRDCITEALKAADQLEWVQRMNAIRHEAAEAVEKELICV